MVAVRVCWSLAEPGTRLAWGTRFGRPAAVVPPVAGVVLAAAARQPSSPGEVQLRGGSAAGAPAHVSSRRTTPRPRARNQSDSSDS